MNVDVFGNVVKYRYGRDSYNNNNNNNNYSNTLY